MIQKNVTNYRKLEWLNQEFLSTQEALEILNISKQGFYSLIARGKLTRIKKGSAVLFFRAEVEGRKREMPHLQEKYGWKQKLAKGEDV